MTAVYCVSAFLAEDCYLPNRSMSRVSRDQIGTDRRPIYNMALS